MSLNLPIKKMREGKTVVYNLTRLKNCALANNTGRTEEYLSTQGEFPAWIAKPHLFLSFAKI